MKRVGRIRDAAFFSTAAILSLALVTGEAFGQFGRSGGSAPRPPSGGTRAPHMFRSAPGTGSLGNASGMSGGFNALGALGAALGGANAAGNWRQNQPNYQSYYPNYQTGYPNNQAGYYQPSNQVYTNQDASGGYQQQQGYSNYSNYPSDSSGFTPPAPPAFEPGQVILVNPAKYSTTVYYRVEGAEYQIPPGTSHTFEQGIVIDYHRGGSFGRQQYSLEPGTYHFQGSPAGWELYNQAK